MSKQFQFDFSISFESDVWEILESHQKLLISTRDSENLQVEFALFDLKDKSFDWSNLSFNESWWVSVYYFSYDLIVFQIYKDTQDIESRTLFGYDCKVQEVLWTLDDVTPIGIRSGAIEMVSQGQHQTIDMRSGEEVDLAKTNEDPQSDWIQYPAHFDQESDHYATLVSFLEDHSEKTPDGGFDYFEGEDLFVISSNFKSESGYSLELLVFNSEGELLLKETLEEDLKGWTKGAFFIAGRALIFVKHKRKLEFYEF